MKLAEALLMRGEMQSKLASLRQRAKSNARVQDGEDPNEDPRELIAEAFGLMRDRSDLIARIHATNLNARLSDGRSMTRALALRDELAARHKLLLEAVEATEQEVDRYSMREIRWVSVLDVKATHKQAEDLARKLRELNARIQEANWQIELIDSPDAPESEET